MGRHVLPVWLTDATNASTRMLRQGLGRLLAARSGAESRLATTVTVA